MVKKEKPAVASTAAAARPAVVAKPEPLKTPVDVYALLKGTDEAAEWEVHKVGCRQYGAAKKRSRYAGSDEDYLLEQVINQSEIIREVWDESIQAEFEEDEKNNGKDYATAPWSWLNAHGYVNSVKFHTCLDGLPAQAKTAAKGANSIKAAKLELATLVAEAAGAMLNELLTPEDGDSAYAAAKTIEAGFKDAAAVRQCVAQWLHGLPCDRDRWVASGMAIPDRSDWAGYIAKMNAQPVNTDGASAEENGDATPEQEEDEELGAPEVDEDATEE